MDDLAAVRTNMRQMAAWLVAQGRGGEYVQVMSTELLAVLDAGDAQAARLAALEAERHKWHECYMGTVNLAVETQAKVDAQAARLVAVEQERDDERRRTGSCRPE